MPIWNTNQKFVRESINSLIDQTMTDWELVIVEDPSEVMSKQTIGEIGDSRVRYFANQTRTSLIRQRNRAIDESSADFVAMLDADDICEPNRLEKQLSFLENHAECDIVGSQLMIINDEGQTIGKRSFPTDHESIERTMSLRNCIPQPGVMFRRKVVLDSNGYQYDRYPCAEDYELWCRLLKKGHRFANHPEQLVSYRIHSNQTKSRKLTDHILATLDIKKTYFSDVKTIEYRLRVLGEHVLLYLPHALVTKLFQLIYHESM